MTQLQPERVQKSLGHCAVMIEIILRQYGKELQLRCPELFPKVCQAIRDDDWCLETLESEDLDVAGRLLHDITMELTRQTYVA